jgi:hypothetical protein
MAFPIFYNGAILFRGGALAFSTNCCCGAFFPCCSSADVTITSPLRYAILNDDPTVLSNGWVLISETPRPDGLLDIHCFVVACDQPPGPGYYYIQTYPGTLDPVTDEVVGCESIFIGDVESSDGSPITLEGENLDNLSGRYYINATCVVQTQCAWIANLNTDGDLTWQQISGTDCLPPDYPPTTEGEIVVQ